MHVTCTEMPVQQVSILTRACITCTSHLLADYSPTIDCSSVVSVTHDSGALFVPFHCACIGLDTTDR